jgi:hypothetical protein
VPPTFTNTSGLELLANDHLWTRDSSSIEGEEERLIGCLGERDKDEEEEDKEEE